ncbi:EmrB/QacA subfamily drug resistance transporter [Okibacterium sp. HSC-33S16]|uniref:MFS transporter n=1 Tax=Okibacterium sp. HSC-33S16 TaxID=2910965 RepID=UPI00209EE68F|nr:MFS transporter [Okibacterium sp. HSC-33S16]MCP2032895.1 EmrB/QacA subfamily drug resistance transporter [Okibacterium sp. HSC-33S16]
MSLPSESPLTATRRWWVLAIVALTQLVVVLDGTIVNIALPQAQQDLGLTDVQRQWVVTAYALAFGALLLLGGRIADYWGRKRSFMVGMIGFGIASAYGGLIGTGVELIVARGLQGVFAALMAPAALAILTTTFPSGRERNTAFAVFGSIGGAGAAVGLLLGGVLTEFFSWRWCLLVNVPVVIIAMIAAAVLLRESKADGDNKYDFLGTVLVAFGLGSLVYGFTLAEEGWDSLGVWACLGAGVVLMALFFFSQSRVTQPLLPLRVIASRVRGGSLLLQMVSGSVMIGMMLYVTLHLQIVLGFSPLLSGVASLPLTIVIGVVAPIATKLLPQIGPKVLMVVGPLIAAGGMVWLSRLSSTGSYWTEVFPGMVLLGIGMAMLFVPMQNLALLGVEPHDAGAASAANTAAMQVGGSIGLGIYTALYTAGSASGTGLDALVSGYSAVFIGTAIALVVGSLIAATFIRGSKESLMPMGETAEKVLHLG